jgi:integrase
VKHHAAIAKFLAEKKATGRFSSERTIVSYRRCLELHAEDANANGHPTVRSVDTGDIVTTLGRWRGQNTKRNRRAILVSYYDWAAANGHRPTNPARSVQAPKRRNNTPPVAGPQEIQAVMAEARRRGGRDWWAIELLAGTGIRRAELLGGQLRDLDRDGWYHVRPEVAKGGRERWVPAGLAIRAVRDDLRKHRGHPKHHILASSQTVEVGVPEPQMKEDPWRPMSQQALMRLVDRVCGPTGANVRFRMTPQAFRRHYGYVIAQEHGIWVAQAVLGHADVGTTVEHYTGIASESDTNAARKTVDARLNWPSGNGEKEAPTGFEPVHGTGKTRR